MTHARHTSHDLCKYTFHASPHSRHTTNLKVVHNMMLDLHVLSLQAVHNIIYTCSNALNFDLNL